MSKLLTPEEELKLCKGDAKWVPQLIRLVMTPTQQRRALALADGWVRTLPKAFSEPLYVRGDDEAFLSELPDYLNDLNAMHGVWGRAIKPNPFLALRFYQNLVDIVETAPDGTHIFGVTLYDAVTNATALQRARAVLAAIGEPRAV